MKAKPVKLVDGVGPVECPISEATHVTINLPGPTGQLTLPVILRGTRDGTNCWSWNGDVEKPTLRPSVRVSSGHFAEHFRKDQDICWCKYNADHPEETPYFHCHICHTWINDGQAQFLPDCTHEFVNKTMDLLDL